MNEHTTAASISPPELLAPAGDWDAARAAVENGADAIYFGLDCGFNARYRAQNFTPDDLPELTAMLRQRGVRGYATVNTLAFPEELGRLAEIISRISQAGVDAILVQDFGVARLARRVAPDLEIHASTQMSLTSGETIAVAAELGLSRVVLPRELSAAEIGRIAAATEMPLEVFIHGALCVAYSGQCLTSESLGGRSANRGQCAQACRLPYELVCDGRDRDLGEVRYLLSPQDLAGYEVIPELVRAGVASLKIEGRLKTAEYVANVTRHYRHAIDQAVREGRVTIGEADAREMELSFSRGFSPGWLQGNDHKRLVPGLSSAKRGIPLGTVAAVGRDQIEVELRAPLALGDGLAIAGGGDRPDEGRQDQGRSSQARTTGEGGRPDGGPADQGGRVYSIRPVVRGKVGGTVKAAEAGQRVWVGFGRGQLDWDRVAIGAAVFKNDDPALNRRLRQTYAGQRPHRTRPLAIRVVARVGQPLSLTGSVAGRELTVVGEQTLDAARRHPATEPMLREKLCRLGGTPFTAGDFRATIEGGPMVPVGMLNALRRELVDRLLGMLAEPPSRRHLAPERLTDIVAQGALNPESLSPESLSPESLSPGTLSPDVVPGRPSLAVLCRTPGQLAVAIDEAVDRVYADFHDIREYRQAVANAREAGVPIGLASIRMHKPGENGLIKAILKHRPDCVLARNLAVIAAASAESVLAVADFSLNVANHLAAGWLIDRGAGVVTPSYDLNRDQLMGFVRSAPAGRLEVVLHQHMPMFHMEHCVFCAVLSPGTNKTNCGRPCDRHEVKLRDRVGAEHPLQADIACRNTLYNATPQSGAEVAGELWRLGVTRFRIELLDQDEAETRRTIDLYRRLLGGQIDGAEVWRSLRAINRLGVTRGTLETARDPLAIL